MKKYKGFFKLIGEVIINSLALILRGMLCLAWVTLFGVWILIDGLARGLDKLIKLMDKANIKLKNRDK